MKYLALMVLAVALVATGFDAEAKRLGGGKSMGRQSSNVTQRDATPPPATPAQPGVANTAAAKPATAAPNAAAPAPKRPWGAMLGGLAAGLGLAWLASSLGLGEAFGQILLFGLLALAIMVVVGMVMRARKNAAAGTGRLAFQGAAGSAQMPSAYSPNNVGNDASARPWERNSMSFDSSRFPTGGASDGGGVVIGSALTSSPSWGVPADFDQDTFLSQAKANFTRLQAAWDASDIPSLRAMMTDEMLSEIRQQLADRETHTGVGANQTDVVMLNAQLLGIEELSEAYMASVEFSGMIREQPSAGPSPFREVWNMTKPKDGSAGWLVAGVQALQ